MRYSTRDIDLGFGVHDSSEYQDKPKVQLLVPEQAPPEERIHYCSSCNKKIEWLEQSRKFICYGCSVSYHELYDTPLASIEQSIQPIQGEHAEKPAFISRKIDRRLQGDRDYSDGIQDVKISSNGRVVKIKTTNLAKAMDEQWIQEQIEAATYG